VYSAKLQACTENITGQEGSRPKGRSLGSGYGANRLIEPVRTSSSPFSQTRENNTNIDPSLFILSQIILLKIILSLYSHVNPFNSLLLKTLKRTDMNSYTENNINTRSKAQFDARGKGMADSYMN
jgi:hypothetical protein